MDCKKLKYSGVLRMRGEIVRWGVRGGLGRVVKAAVTVGVFAVLQASPAYADALLRITPLGASVGSYSGPTGPVPIGANGFRLSFHGGGTQTLVNPVMLIFGIPNGAVAPAVTAGAMSGGFTSVAIDLGDSQSSRYGGSWNSTTGFAGTFNASSNPKVYDQIGFFNGSDSENYTNWTGATGLSSWNLFVYALTFSPAQMQRGDYVEFATSLPVGSYVIGYGCEALSAGGTCKNPGARDSTPFTFSGLVTQVPEPATLTILGLGLLGFSVAQRRKIAKR